ncbi:MAG TPA: hypothetical protein VHN99_02395, partial [Deinococcales bacterium]|nr:hypothetical protein [Deinococcales bacterium]
FSGDLSVPDGGYNLDLRVEKAGKPLTGTHLVAWHGIEDDGVFALTEPNLSEINRITLIVALSLGVPVGLALIALAWGLAQNRRKDREAAPLDLPLPDSGG